MPKNIKLMMNNEKRLSSKIKVSGQKLKLESQFKYVGLIISEGGPRIEIISRRKQKMVTFPKLSGKTRKSALNQRSDCCMQ